MRLYHLVDLTFGCLTRDGDRVKSSHRREVAVSFMITRTWYQISICLRLANTNGVRTRKCNGEVAWESMTIHASLYTSRRNVPRACFAHPFIQLKYTVRLFTFRNIPSRRWYTLSYTLLITSRIFVQQWPSFAHFVGSLDRWIVGPLGGEYGTQFFIEPAVTVEVARSILARFSRMNHSAVVFLSSVPPSQSVLANSTNKRRRLWTLYLEILAHFIYESTNTTKVVSNAFARRARSRVEFDLRESASTRGNPGLVSLFPFRPSPFIACLCIIGSYLMLRSIRRDLPLDVHCANAWWWNPR